MIKQYWRLGRIMQSESWRYNCYGLHTANTVQETNLTKRPSFNINVSDKRLKVRLFQKKYFIWSSKESGTKVIVVFVLDYSKAEKSYKTDVYRMSFEIFHDVVMMLVIWWYLM